MRSGLRLLAPLFGLGLVSCGGESPAAKAPEATAPAATAQPQAETPPRFANPGGMWMPHQVKDHAAKLAELGLAIDPAALADPTSGVLSAVVSLGGCSASFISAEGLVATNHHCATGALQHNSSATANLLKDGFLAKTRAEEKNNGPQARVFVTRAVTDITSKMTAGLEKIADDQARYKEIEKRQKDAVAACEKGRTGTRCSAAPFYERAQWFLIEQLEIRDVRLVWAPPAGVGNYGGEIDNWRWPRHTGDVTLFRAYVGKDGQPADFSPDNVPYKPPHHLKIASSPLREGDLVFVAGYPGRTNTLKTKAEVDEAVTWAYPRRQKLYEDYLARLEEVTKDDKEAQIRATSYVRRFGNVLTNTKGQLEGLVKGGLAAEKERSEKALREFVAADPQRQAQWGKALDEIATEIAKHAEHRERNAQLDEVVMPRLVGAAMTIVRMAEERAKPDAARDPDFQQRNWSRVEQALKGLSTNYHRKVDEAVLGLALERVTRAPEAERSPALAYVLQGAGAPEKKPGAAVPTPSEIAAAVTKLYATTTLGDEKARLELLTKGTTASLRQSKDPLIKLALALRPLQKEIEQREERFAGKMALLKPKYIEALRAFKKEPFAPDANSTLRITYGTVRGYKPAPDAPMHEPFTLLSEVVGKNTGKEPFDVPAPVLEAIKAKKVGPYVDEKLGEVPVDFLADLHITGGNSGSATLNAKGELVGLAFDGNYEAMASDWLFTPSITRSIHVDMRYVLWLLDGPFGADHILEEIGVTPKL
ncbi:MAG: peptidase S46 [Myxococcales bacterium 68-20]|nr:S46 family peptidase [Myxococcales bacterium]OJY24605.1 MAG: peptidase S46 [Myxococcales bacterium 68-20]